MEKLAIEEKELEELKILVSELRALDGSYPVDPVVLARQIGLDVRALKKNTLDRISPGIVVASTGGKDSEKYITFDSNFSNQDLLRFHIARHLFYHLENYDNPSWLEMSFRGSCKPLDSDTESERRSKIFATLLLLPDGSEIDTYRQAKILGVPVDALEYRNSL